MSTINTKNKIVQKGYSPPSSSMLPAAATPTAATTTPVSSTLGRF